jgi:hypothetical protein
MVRWSAVLSIMAAMGCSEQKVSIYNTPPGVDISSPSDDELFDLGEPIHFEALVADSQDDPDELSIVWESSVDGPLDDDASDSAGLVFFDSSILSAGSHTVSLTATDSDGESSTMSVSINVGGAGLGGEGAPQVSLDGPAEGDVVLQSEPVTVIGMVTDDEQPWGTVDCTVISSRDGLLWEGRPTEVGIVQVDMAGLSVGNHTLTLGAVDRDANQASAQVSIEVVADARPSVLITSPGESDWYWNTDTIRFEGEVSDDVTDPSDLALSWASDIDGEFSALPANPVGMTAVETVLNAGYHNITLQATDSDGNQTTDAMILEVRDPLAHDGDLDGYSEYDGDCDDADPYTNPGEEEVCDAADNDCDGMINEDDWDDLEPDDEMSSATDLGRIDDGWVFSSAESASAGITLHSNDDEDWLRFDAGDDFFIDNVNITVEVGAFPSTGSFVLELYLLDESSTVPVAIDTGSGRLNVHFEGDPFDGGEDDFAIRVFSDDWPAGSCDRRYTVEIIDH